MSQRLKRKLLPAIQSKHNILLELVINTVKKVLLQAFLFSNKKYKQSHSFFIKYSSVLIEKEKNIRIPAFLLSYIDHRKAN